MNAPERFLAACARRPVDRTPVWMMRQAGRYLPEYRAVRERVDFLTLCKTPELAAQVSLQPIERFGMDACIVFSDILIPVEAMGVPLTFGDAGPRLEQRIRDRSDVDALCVPDPNGATPFVMETLRLIRRALLDRAAVVGFTGAPFTLASYIIEGGGSKNFAATKALMYAQPQLFHALLDKLASTVAEYAAAQAAAGAQAVQVFDTWAGELEPHAFEEFALPYQARVIERIRGCGVPAILYVNGCAGVLERMALAGADVLSVDWRIDLSAARARVGGGVALQGNVDPSVLLSTPARVTEAAFAALESAGPVGHILNLGHGILPQTPLSCAAAFVDASKAAADAVIR
jgi:uroporphyrinogen decarboxylase